MPKISKLLIANRGEIAVRIIRSAHDAGIRTVAIYADQDRNSSFVRLANEAFTLSGKEIAETYLSPKKILSIAAQSGADSIHPGYGFLSENADFAQMVVDSGLVWVGPPPEAIRALGDKVSARRIAQKVGAPLSPGTTKPITSAEQAREFAAKNGFPIAIKAAHGGGGRGLKVAFNSEQIPDVLASAVREAEAAFGKGECFVEKYLENPRHVETQCLADVSGNVVVISTRDCTLQRRHQKLVEEAPAPFLTDEQEKLLYDSSKALLREVGYLGAGTCEFLVDASGTVSFLEVNTRLQVEHPVSEEVTGIDLVREQFRIAEGEELGYSDPVPTGHAIEFRINGEDPGREFLPTPGSIRSIRFPEGPGIRVDSGITAGDTISGSFDSLLAKLIVRGSTRKEALERSRRALLEFQLDGIPTLLPFHRAIVEDPAFSAQQTRDFRVHTTWIEKEFQSFFEPWSGPAEEGIEATPLLRPIIVEVEGRRLEVAIPEGIYVAGQRAGIQRAPKRAYRQFSRDVAGQATIIAPMQAKVVEIIVTEGQEVVLGDVVCILEAMKMEQRIVSPVNGIILSLGAKSGESISAGHPIVVISSR